MTIQLALSNNMMEFITSRIVRLFHHLKKENSVFLPRLEGIKHGNARKEQKLEGYGDDIVLDHGKTSLTQSILFLKSNLLKIQLHG